VATQVAEDVQTVDANSIEKADLAEPVSTPEVPAVQEISPPQSVQDEPVTTTSEQQVVEEPVLSETKAAAVVDQPRYKLHATAPMTKAPAPAYHAEPARHSDWVRPDYPFSGKGSAGGHAAVNQSTAPATKPTPVSE
ncbi:ribonuclease E, partial [Pectobacterium versatile]